jgi:hypothetical protein
MRVCVCVCVFLYFCSWYHHYTHRPPSASASRAGDRRTATITGEGPDAVEDVRGVEGVAGEGEGRSVGGGDGGVVTVIKDLGEPAGVCACAEIRRRGRCSVRQAHHATRNVKEATCNVQHATSIMQPQRAGATHLNATRSTPQETRRISGSRPRSATCGIQHGTPYCRQRCKAHLAEPVAADPKGDCSRRSCAAA